MNYYTLNDFNNLIFTGFNYTLPSDTLQIISNLALEVGSPNYVKTPIFQKKEKLIDKNFSLKENNSSTFKKRKGNKGMEICEEDWESIRTFQATKIETKEGLDAQIDLIRSNLNKLSDRNFPDIKLKILDIIEKIVSETYDKNELNRVSTSIFDIASNNRFYSKLYADLYCDIINNYETMKTPFEDSLKSFTELFNVIEYVDPSVDYNKFCAINKNNEKRKSLAAFFVNLMLNNLISKETITEITRNLLQQFYIFISEENKKNEVDELVENIAILFKKELYTDEECYKIDGMTIVEVIEKIANSKVKEYKSLTNKSLFKFMDMIDM